MTRLFFLLCLLYAAPALADDYTQETLFSGNVEHGGYGGPVIKVASIKDETALLVGGYGGWFINHTIMIGGGGYGLVNNIDAPPGVPLANGMKQSVGFGYGGGMIEFTGNSDALVHYTAHLLVGAGGAGYYVRTTDIEDIDPDFDEQWDACLAAEVGAGVEINVTTFFRINAGASYLFINGLDIPELTDSDISGPAAHLTLKFGKF